MRRREAAETEIFPEERSILCLPNKKTVTRVLFLQSVPHFTLSDFPVRHLRSIKNGYYDNSLIASLPCRLIIVSFLTNSFFRNHQDLPACMPALLRRCQAFSRQPAQCCHSSSLNPESAMFCPYTILQS